MPVFNEEATIERVVRTWAAEFERLGIRYEFAIYNDGSTDHTTEQLEGLTDEFLHLRVTRQRNVGHGPTILRGYREATGVWVFQADGDDEIPAAPFENLWRQRDRYDLLVGRREGRAAPIPRRIVSHGARLAVWLLFGRGISDVNVPYRLVRKSCLDRMLWRIPPDIFAPNVVMTGLAVQDHLRIYECPVPYRPRRTGVPSLAGWGSLRVGGRCLRETLGVRLAERASRCSAPPSDAR